MSKLFTILLIIVLAILLIWTFYPAPAPIVQPLVYNHKIHIEEAELECSDCHIYVEKMARASIPNIEICSDCHGDEPISDSPQELILLKYIEEGKKIPWQRIYRVPDHVYFSHRRHIVLGELDCSECHGNVAELTEPASFPLLKVSMGRCLKCHKQHKVTNDCLACHH